MPKTPTDIASLARKHTALALRVLKEVAGSPKAQNSARVAAATALLDRGWGKPKQTLEHEGNPLAVFYDSLTHQPEAPTSDGAKKANGHAGNGTAAD